MTLCFDLDGTICHTRKGIETYLDVLPIEGMPELLRSLKADGHTIIIDTARHMATCDNNVGKIIAKQGYNLFKWFEKYDIPYDEIHFGKPLADIYIDDKACKFITTKELKSCLLNV